MEISDIVGKAEFIRVIGNNFNPKLLEWLISLDVVDVRDPILDAREAIVEPIARAIILLFPKAMFTVENIAAEEREEASKEMRGFLVFEPTIVPIDDPAMEEMATIGSATIVPHIPELMAPLKIDTS